MSPWRERAARLVCACVLLGGTPWATPQPGDAQGVVEDLHLTVESLDGSESEVRDRRRVTVALTSDVLFATDEAELTAKARDRLRRVAGQIRAEGARGVVTIAGHTDDRASRAYNLGLSERRARAVRAALARLLAGGGLDLRARGYGEGRPRAANTTSAGRAKNRRVEIGYGLSQPGTG